MRRTEWSRQRSGGVSSPAATASALGAIGGGGNSAWAIVPMARSGGGAGACGRAAGCGSQVFERRLQWLAGSQQPPAGAIAQAKQALEITAAASNKTKPIWNVVRNTASWGSGQSIFQTLSLFCFNKSGRLRLGGITQPGLSWTQGCVFEPNWCFWRFSWCLRTPGAPPSALRPPARTRPSSPRATGTRGRSRYALPLHFWLRPEPSQRPLSFRRWRPCRSSPSGWLVPVSAFNAVLPRYRLQSHRPS
jgi:hypothetical protein